MSRPTEPVPTPSVVTGIAAGRPVDAVWVNELGGVTFAIAGGSEYVKVTPARWAHGLEGEVCRLGWAATYLRVPRVLGAGDGWLHTAGLPGTSAADLAVAEWSLRYNYGGDWRDEFFDAYGVAPDQDRMDHYLRLWEDGD